MRRTRLVGAVAALLVLSLLVVPSRLPLRAQTAPAPAQGAARMVVVAESGGVIALNAADATVLFELADPAGVRAVAADEPRGRVWAYSPGTLHAYRLDGTIAVTVTLPTPPGYTSTTPVSLVVHPENGSVWLAVGLSLQHLDAQGNLLLTLTFGSPIRVLALDPPRARIWVGTATSLAAYADDTGQVVASVALGGSTLLDAVVEPTSGHVFAALDTALRRYDLTGAIVLNVLLPLSSQRWVARDGAGGAWAATPNVLARVTSTGTLAVFQSPWQGPGPIVGLAADPTDQTAWVGSSPGAVTHVGPAGVFLHQLTLWAALTVRDLAFLRDLVAPVVSFTAPLNGAALNTSTPHLELSYSDLGAGVDPATLHLTADGQALAASCTPAATSATCTPTAALLDGAHTLAATVTDTAGNASQAAQVQVTIDTVAPAVTLSAPAAGLLTNQAQQAVAGSVSEAATLILRLNGAAVQTLALSSTNTFTSAPVTLAEGLNGLEVVALDAAGNQGVASRTVTLDTVPPAAVAASALSVGPVTTGQVTVSGAAGSVESGAQVTIRNPRTGVLVTVVAAADGSFTAAIAAEAGDPLSITSTDGAGNISGATDVPVGGGLPPDPATVAPALDLTVATDLASATVFLYTGPTPIQTGVAPGTIEPRRVAVLRGAVKTRDGAALSGVTITVLGHPEYGQTLSRADGAFDLAVNGGGVLTVQYEKVGFLPVQRQVPAPWQDYAWLPEVVLIPLDPQVTAITTNALAMQVAQGSPVIDTDGTRRATLLVPAGTTATMGLPDGTSQPLATLHVRATEYTVGTSGPAAMPGPLPPTSGYTYAVELSADETSAAGTATVRFNQPVVHYVENFLNFSVGGSVPTASYDRERAGWIPSTNGRVVKILSVANGLADLDLTGSGVAADAAALSALGVTDAERQQLAALYPVGQSLWRVPITHFTPWDHNWPYGPPADARSPQQPAPAETAPLDTRNCTKCPGSVIEAENQILGEALNVTGTPLRLHYQSDRVLGRRTANTLSIPLSGASMPASLARIELEVVVAGQRVTQTFPAAPNQTTTFTWDGRDAYGRQLQGTQPVTIRIGYVYPAVYQQPAQFGASFGAVSGAPISGNPARQEITVWQEQAGSLETLGTWDARAQALGGWTLSVHHAYDPAGRVLSLGDGRRRSGQDVSRVIVTVAGTGAFGFGGDGGPALEAQVAPRAVAVAPDGSLYLADDTNRIRRVGPDGVITTVAGNGTFGFGGDGGPATQAAFANPLGVALGPDGSLYVADTFNNRIRRIRPDGIITTVAGNGGFAGGDGGPATTAGLFWPEGVAVAADGSLYIADTQNHLLRRVGPDGMITTVAGMVTGGATGGFGGDGGPAAQALLKEPHRVALARDGSLYIADYRNRRIRRVGSDGLITTVAGNGDLGFSGDGGPATDAAVGEPRDIAVGPDGGLYLADGTNRLRRVGADGVIATIAGTGAFVSSGDGGPATQAGMSPVGIAFAPDGTLYVADNVLRVRRVGPPLPGVSSGDLAIPSEDGREVEVYVFDARGRHLHTVDALTNALLYRFTYDAAGRLTAVEDRAGLVTGLERDAAGTPTAIVAPGGQRTTLTVDANGYLAGVTNPAGEATRLSYSPDGLLASLTDAKGQVTTFAYDARGRLIHDADPAGGFSALARTERPTDYTVTLSSALNRVSTFQVSRVATGGLQRVATAPSGAQTITQIGTDGSRMITSPDGTVTSVVEGPDPRFRMQAPVASSSRITTPGGLISTRTQTRSVTLADPLNPLSLTTQTDAVTLNGRTATSTFDAALKTLTDRTTAGRQAVSTLDTQGRVIQVQPAGLEPTSFTYDLRGRPATVTRGTGPAARTSTFGYDLQDRLVSLTDPLGRTVGFAYDLADRVTTQTLPDGRQISFLYDANGNVTSVTPPGRPAHAFGYTPVNLEATYTPPLLDATNPTTTTAYNLDRQPTLVTRPDGQTLSVGYDAGGRLSTLTQPRGVTRLAYHPTTGQLTTVTAPEGGTLSYTYDGGLVTSETWGGPVGAVAGSVSRTYDNDFRLASETVNGAQGVTFGYDPDSLLTQAGALSLSRDPQTGFVTGTTLGSLTDTRSYSTFGELSAYRAAVETTALLDVQYTRDSLGRITQKSETIAGVTDSFSYTYL